MLHCMRQCATFRANVRRCLADADFVVLHETAMARSQLRQCCPLEASEATFRGRDWRRTTAEEVIVAETRN